ncbi:pericentriolar material 1 [Labeo rohita]|uniref:Pericentriolar material 1 n=1 Tax=Labeo rohita TaxID=84645 RepID=A0A498NFV5_LABRO|nr:pericentriolar material 1 [Labeo rohita]
MMATGGTPFEDGTDEQELHNWSISNGSLDDRLNNMDWGVQQKKANRTSEKNRKKFSAMSESRLTNDISPESTPGAGRRRARTPHSFPHVKYSTQMSVPDQAELDRLRQVINFTDLDERSIGSDSQGRVTAANNQRQLSTEAKKPFNFLPIHLNTNKSKEPTASTSSTPGGKEPKKQSPGKEQFAPVPAVVKEPFSLDGAQRFGLEDEKAELSIDSSQVVSKLVQIREYIGKATSMRDDLVEKNDVPANVERLSLLITHLKEQEKSYLRFLQKMLGHGVCGEQKEELENMRKQHDLLKKMLEQQEQLRALQGRQAALLAMQQSAEQAIAVMDDTVVTETTGSVSGRSITSELNDELNDLIQRFHNQLHDSQELQDKKQTMDKILQELHSLRDQTLNNNSCQSVSQRGARIGMSERPSVLGREGNGPRPVRQDSSSPYTQIDDNHPADKLRKLKEVHKRLNELRELVQYYEQTSDMVVDTVNENVKEDDDETEDGSLFEAMFDSEQENHEPVTNIRNPAQPQTPSNWMDMNRLAKAHSASNNRDGRLNTECEINNRSAANLRSLNVPSVIECQFNRDRPYDGVKDEEDDEALEDDDGARGGGRDSDGSGSSRRSSLVGETDYAQKVRRLQTAKQKLRQLQELVAMVQSDDTDGTTANEDEGLKQQPNNTRATAPKVQRDIALSEKTREKLYEEKLKQQQQELKQLHEERQRLMEIQGKIQDLQWACPDLQSSVSSSISGQMRKIPAAASTPAPVPLHSSSSAKANTSGLKPTTEPPPVTVTDNELWSEMRRHQMLREELRQRRKHLESLMAEQQRRSTLTDSPFRSDTHDTQSYSRDESLKVHREINGSGPRGRPRQHPQTERGSSSRAKRQENLRWAADLSLSEGAAPAHWQEQITHLQKQLNFSTTMCQTLLQDQQTLSYMLQALLTGPYGVVPNNVTSPQIPLIMHQLNQCYTQLAWQQNNVNRLKQVLNDLLRQQQSQSLSGQQQHQNVAHDSASSSLFGNYPPVSTLNMPGLPNFSPFSSGFNFNPVFPSSVGDFQQNQASSDQQHDPNISLKTEYMSFPPPLQRSPLNNAEKRFQSQPDTLPDANNSSWLNSSLNHSGQRTTLTSNHQSQIEQNSPSSSPVPHPSTSRDLSYIPDSQESISSLPDRADPTTVTKTFRAGRKAAAQASLASRDKTPNTKSRRRRGRGQKNTASVDSDSVSSDSHFGQDRERSSQVKYKDLNQGLLDKLTQEKLDSKTKNSKPNDLSSGNTVIHLDKALARMREYERMKLRAECNTDNPERSPGAAAAASALTQGAGHSSTDAHCPQIDTQQLDRQIKAIMTEVIPFLKEHVGEVCSHQLLTSVRRMVLKLTQQNDESKEFVRFFHRQLGGILQDSLSKFVGRTLQDCGEDLLVEISEILFNELAFFRLMQDLDQNTSKNKHRSKKRSDHTSPKHSPHTEEVKMLEREKTFSPSYFDEDRDQDETEQGGTLHEREEDKEKDAQSSETSEVEEEEGEGLPLSISLSKAETQALCNYGSGEDENEVEEIEEFEAGPVEVQTSLQASMDNTSEHKQGSALQNEAPQEAKSDVENAESSQLKSIKSESKDLVQPPEEGREEAKTGSGDEREEKEDCTISSAQETPQNSDTASPDTESPVMINTDEAGSGNTSQRSDEEDFVKVEDLPLQMSVLCEEELCKRISEEQQNNNLTAEILNGNKEELTGLVGNAQALKEPETSGAQSA